MLGENIFGIHAMEGSPMPSIDQILSLARYELSECEHSCFPCKYEWIISIDILRIIDDGLERHCYDNISSGIPTYFMGIDITPLFSRCRYMALRKKQPKWLVEETRKELEMRIKDVIFNPPATIVFWQDETKTVVKAQEGEDFDPEKGLAMAMAKKAYGNKGNYFNNISKWTEKYVEKCDVYSKRIGVVTDELLGWNIDKGIQALEEAVTKCSKIANMDGSTLKKVEEQAEIAHFCNTCLYHDCYELDDPCFRCDMHDAWAPQLEGDVNGK